MNTFTYLDSKFLGQEVNKLKSESQEVNKCQLGFTSMTSYYNFIKVIDGILIYLGTCIMFVTILTLNLYIHVLLLCYSLRLDC